MKPDLNQHPEGWSPESARLLATLQAALGHFLVGFVELSSARLAERLHLEAPPPQPKLAYTKSELAQAFSCSVSSIDRMRAEGLPTFMIGESPRFDPVAVMAWLQSREAAR